MPGLECVGNLCLQTGHWILAIAGVVALMWVIWFCLSHAAASLVAALHAFGAFLSNLFMSIGFLIFAVVVLFLLYCGVTGTWQHIRLPW